MTDPQSNWHWRKIEIVVAVLVVLLLAAILIPAVQNARETARRSQSRNGLKQVGVAFHNYHETFECFPPGGTFASDGTPHHSWTLFIQPYMSASRFYIGIDMDRPWNVPNNRDKFRTGHSYLEDPSLPHSRTSDGLPVVHYAPNQRLFHRNSSSRLKDVPEQTQTLMIADAFGEFVPFGDPINWRDATIPFRTSAQGFGHIAAVRRDGTHVLFVDGSVEFVSNSSDEEQYRQLAGTSVPEPSDELTAAREASPRAPGPTGQSRVPPD